MRWLYVVESLGAKGLILTSWVCVWYLFITSECVSLFEFQTIRKIGHADSGRGEISSIGRFIPFYVGFTIEAESYCNILSSETVVESQGHNQYGALLCHAK